MIPRRGAFPPHWDGRPTPRRTILNRLGKLLRKPFLALEAFIAFAILACSIDAQGTTDGRNAYVWFAPAVREVFKQGFSEFETNPDAPRLFCVSDWHWFDSETQPNTLMVVVFEGSHSASDCKAKPGEKPKAMVMYFGQCPQVTQQLQEAVNKSGTPLLMLACKRATGFWFQLVIPQERRA